MPDSMFHVWTHPPNGLVKPNQTKSICPTPCSMCGPIHLKYIPETISKSSSGKMMSSRKPLHGRKKPMKL
ncbi:hypothetical protein CDAR_440051, partial [Caerostris darwini]